MNHINHLPRRATTALAALAVVALLVAHMVIPASAGSLQLSDAHFTIRVPLVLTAAGWLPPTDHITPAVGCVHLTPGMNGVN